MRRTMRCFGTAFLVSVVASCGGSTKSSAPGDTVPSAAPHTAETPDTTSAADTTTTPDTTGAPDIIAAPDTTSAPGTTSALDMQDAATELRRLVEGDDDVRAAWVWVGPESTPNVTPAAGVGSTAAVVWIEDFNEVRLDSVSEVVDCDDVCLGSVTTWAEAQLASEWLPTVAGEPRCGNCEEAPWLSFVTVEPDDGFAVIEAESVAATIGDVDTAYEVMLSFGRIVRVRNDGGRWRAVDEQVVSDCDPVVVEYTMYSVATSGEREQLARREWSDSSCA